MTCADVPPATEASPTPDATRVGMPAVVETSRPAASMFATGATSSAHTPAADMAGYSNSRRASNSRLIAEISPSTCCTDALTATFSATRSANAAGT